MHPQVDLVSNNVEHSTDPYYSNEDVEILHNIVVLAQELLPSLPERERLPTNALFNAYYDILPRAGIDADHDSRYARILFKIGGLRGPATLYEKFEEVLSRMGIEIEFDSGAIDEDDSQLSHSHTEQDDFATGDTSLPSNSRDSRSRPRRNSESSVWDLSHQTPAAPRTRRNSFSSVGPIKLSTSVGERKFSEEHIADQGLPITINTLSANNAHENVRTWLSPRSTEVHNHRGRSDSTHGSQRIRHDSPSISITHQAAPDSHHPSEFTETTADIGNEASTRASTPLHSATRYEEPCASMEIKASEVYEHTIGTYAQLQLRRWKEKALHAQERNACFQQIATQHDRKALLHSALDAWRSSFQERRELAEKRKYYKDLEQRAQKARDLRLMDLALSHWSSLTREQVQRTARAREHIVKTRIFTAWKDVTAADEAKARKQVLKKFLVAWKHRSSTVAQANVAAVQRYEANLVEKLYRQWLLNVWNSRASNWYAERLALRALTHWSAKSRSIQEADRKIQDKRSLESASKLLQVWRAKKETRVQRNEQAGAYYDENLCRSVFQKWRRETKIVPAERILQTDVSKRLLGEAFGIWRKRASQERQAAAVDRTKILHEALTVWRHKQRAQELGSRIDNRVLKDAMHSWILVAREKRAQQSSNDQLLRRLLRTWKNKQQVLTEQREERERMAQSFAARQSQNLVLRQWYSCMETQQRNEIAAVDFYAPRLVQGSLTEWSNKLQHIRQLEQRSRDAEYYFLASKTLKLWKAATEAAQREKRKAAYIQVRRNIKLNLARRVLKTWQSKAQPIIELQKQASDTYHNKQTALAMDIFDRWKGRAEQLSESESIARENVLRKHVTVWKERLNTQQALSTEATIAYQELRQSRTLKKWSLTTLQLRAQANYAREIREKNAKRNVRKILVYWHQRTVPKHPPAIEPSSMSETGETTEPPEPLEPPERYRADLGQSLPLPGYLSTPSKRLSRLSTTPKVPLSTPFERRLRAQWSGEGEGRTPRSRLVD